MFRHAHKQANRVRVVLSFLGTFLIAVGVIGLTPSDATAQGCQQLGCDEVPPVVTPSFDPPILTSDTLRITWCDNEWLMPATRAITLNGSNVVGNFTYGAAGGGCASNAVSVDSIRLQPGVTYTLFATIEDEHGNIGTGSVEYTAPNGFIVVNPKGLNVSKPQQSTSLTQAFVVKNPDTTANNYRLVRTCSGQVSSCSAVPDTVHLNGGDSSVVSVTYNTGPMSSGTTGSIRLRARMTTDTTVADSTDVGVTLVSSLIVDDSPNNNDAQNMKLCAYACFANIYAQSTVPYFSLDQPRGVTLVYNHTRMFARPYLLFNISTVSGAPTVNKLKMTVQDSATGGMIRVQGDNNGGDAGIVYFSRGNGTVRIATYIDDDTWLLSHGTGIHPVRVMITAIRTGLADEVDTLFVPVLIVRESPGAVARGWYIDGVQRLVPQSGGRVLIVEADGSAFVFTATDTLGNYGAPSGEFSRLSRTGVSTSTIYTRAYSDSSKVRFDYQGRMLDASDSWGNKVRYAYDAYERPTRVYDPFRTRPDSTAAPSAYTQLVYFADSVLIRPPQADGSSYDASRVTRLRLTSDSLLRAVVDPDGDSTRFAYRAGILAFPLHTRPLYLEKVHARTGTDSSVFEYDDTPQFKYTGSYLLLRTKAPVIATYTSGGNTTNSTPTTELYDWRGRGVPQWATSSSSLFTPIRVDTLYSEVRDEGSHQSWTAHDRWGQLLKLITHAKKDTTTWFRSGLFPDSVRKPIGTVDRFTYTVVSGGRPALQSSTPAGQSSTYYGYDGLGQVDSIIAVNSATFITRQNANPAHIDLVTRNGYTTIYEFDSKGRLKKTTDPLSHDVEAFFDDTFGNTRKTLYEGGRFDSVRFDGYGRDSILTSTVASTRLVTYDVLNRVKRDSIAGASGATAYTYDKQHLLRMVDPKGQIFKREVNALGWTRRVYDSADTTKYVRHEYTVEGLPALFVNRRGHWKEMSYSANDNRHLLTATNAENNTYFNRATYSYSYKDSLGRRIGTVVVGANNYATDSVFTDSLGRLRTVVTQVAANRSSGIGGTLGQRRFIRNYTWNELGQLLVVNLETRQANGGSLIRSFAGRNYWWNSTTRALDSISIAGLGGNGVASIKRDGEGKDSVWSLPGLNATVLATKRHEPWLQSFSEPAIDSVLRRGYAYTDTIAGRVADMTIGLGNTLWRRFRYSPQSDLTWLNDVLVGSDCESPPGGGVSEIDGYTCSPSSPTAARTLGLEYDAARNLRKQVDSVSMAVDTAIVAAGNRLTSWGSTTYTFDADGNMTTRTSGGTTTTFSYDGESMLRRTIVGSDTTCYDYNAFNQLVFSGKGCEANTNPQFSPRYPRRIFVWDRGQIIAEVDSLASTRLAEYVYRPGTDRPHAFLTDSGGGTIVRFYHQDMLGNVIALTREASLSQALTYEPWGELTASTGTLADSSRLRWKGLYWEGGNTNLYYVRNRWYDPQARRFTAEDPIGIDGGMNQYTFGENDWVNSVDPSGLRRECFRYFTNGTTVSSPLPVAGAGGAGSSTTTPGGSHWVCFDVSNDDLGAGGNWRVPVDPSEDILNWGLEGGGSRNSGSPANRNFAACLANASNAGTLLMGDFVTIAGIGIGVRAAALAGVGGWRLLVVAGERAIFEYNSMRYVFGSAPVTMKNLGRTAKDQIWGQTNAITASMTNGEAPTLRSMAKGFLPFINTPEAIRQAYRACF